MQIPRPAADAESDGGGVRDRGREKKALDPLFDEGVAEEDLWLLMFATARPATHDFFIRAYV